MTVDIKPLAWERWEFAGTLDDVWEAKTPFGCITVHRAPAPASPTWCWSSATDAKYGYQTADAAKAGAAAWWESAVTKCLTQTEEHR